MLIVSVHNLIYGYVHMCLHFFLLCAHKYTYFDPFLQLISKTCILSFMRTICAHICTYIHIYGYVIGMHRPLFWSNIHAHASGLNIETLSLIHTHIHVRAEQGSICLHRPFCVFDSVTPPSIHLLLSLT